MESDEMMEERKELMVSPTGGKPILRTSHFLKPSMGDPSSAFFPSNLIIGEIKETRYEVKFCGRKYPQSRWKEWVDRLKPLYREIWKRAGIFEAILASTYQTLRDNELVLKLAEKWCFETNTFVFPWGEATITLEDMAILGGYSVLGDYVLSPLGEEDKDLIEIEKSLKKSHGVVSQKHYQGTIHTRWMEHFMGTDHRLEHEAFLALWLSRYVFPMYYDGVRKNVFPIAVKLSRGISIALAPAVLASIYKDLRCLKLTLTPGANLDQCRFNKSGQLELNAPFHLVQLWAWERFPTLRPEPNSLNSGEPRAARWHKLPKRKVESIEEAIDKCSFQWRPYVSKAISGHVLVRCLRVSELVGFDDCIEQYLPHRVALQFGYDQDLPGYVTRKNETPEIAWRNYNRPVRDPALYSRVKLFRGDVTIRYFKRWEDSRESSIRQSRKRKGSLNYDDTSKVVGTLNDCRTARKSPVKRASRGSPSPTSLHDADNVTFLETSAGCDRENEGAKTDDDDVTIAEVYNFVNDDLKVSEGLALRDADEDNITIAERDFEERLQRLEKQIAEIERQRQ